MGQGMEVLVDQIVHGGQLVFNGAIGPDKWPAIYVTARERASRC